MKSIVKNQLIVRFLLLLKEKEKNVSDIVNWDLVVMQQYVHSMWDKRNFSANPLTLAKTHPGKKMAKWIEFCDVKHVLHSPVSY